VRVAVVGTSGSGKSTFARRLAELAGAPFIELDAINWQADWRDLNTHDPEEFRRRVAQAVAQESWVSDGNYAKVRDLILARATDLIWLDYTRLLTLRRVVWRSFRRALSKKELWPGTGNREEFRRWLDREHPIRWAWDTYHARRAAYAAIFDDPATAHLKKHRLRHPREAAPLMAALAKAETQSAA
jgi:adenylate kinase family enzyme